MPGARMGRLVMIAVAVVVILGLVVGSLASPVGN
jgi:hypothetical protein